MFSDNKLQKFISAVNEDVDEKIAAMLAEAEEEKSRIISEAEAEAELKAEKYFTEKSKKNGTGFVKELSAAELDMKRKILIHRDKLSDSVFEQVKGRLAEYRKTNAYADSLIKTLLLLNVNSSAEIRLSPDDMKYADALKKVVKSPDTVFCADESIKLGGLAIYCKDKGMIIDKTFDLALDEQRQAFVAANAFA